jgi:uncharacterized protein YeaO (DUF488 family)
MAERLQVKRIYEPAATDDGARILVDRIWPRGVTKSAAALTLWLKDIAPSNSLRKWFGHDPERWMEFSSRYRKELDANGAPVAHLRAFLKEGPVTLLYGAHDAAHNQAIVLADYIRKPAMPRKSSPKSTSSKTAHPKKS